jgi:hypothetical protein
VVPTVNVGLVAGKATPPAPLLANVAVNTPVVVPAAIFNVHTALATAPTAKTHCPAREEVTEEVTPVVEAVPAVTVTPDAKVAVTVTARSTGAELPRPIVMVVVPLKGGMAMLANPAVTL